MKKYLFLLTIVVIVLVFPTFASADDSIDGYIMEFEEILPDDVKELVKSPDSMIDLFSLRGILSEITSAFSGDSGGASRFFMTLLGSVVLIAVASICHQWFSLQVQAAVGVICSLAIFPTINSAFLSISDSLAEINNFFLALIPIASGITAIGGGVTTASVQAGGMFTAFSVIGGLGGKIFISFSAFGLAISLLSAFGSESAAAVGKGIKSLFMWLVGISAALITGAYALQTVVASAQDSASIRTARYVASGLIPVVGSTVAGALATLASGLSYAKSIIGAGARVALLSLVISPLAMLILYRFALTLAGMLSDLTGTAVASRILSAYRFSVDMTVAVYALSALVYLFEIILFLRIGVALQ